MAQMCSFRAEIQPARRACSSDLPSKNGRSHGRFSAAFPTLSTRRALLASYQVLVAYGATILVVARIIAPPFRLVGLQTGVNDLPWGEAAEGRREDTWRSCNTEAGCASFGARAVDPWGAGEARKQTCPRIQPAAGYAHVLFGFVAPDRRRVGRAVEPREVGPPVPAQLGYGLLDRILRTCCCDLLHEVVPTICIGGQQSAHSVTREISSTALQPAGVEN